MSEVTQSADARPTHLKRELGVFGSVIVGLGSILGTGVFVSLALGAEIAGPWMLLAVVIAACVATCNGLSSAQLAAVHSVSGGTYEYGYRVLSPSLGFAAGWLFLCAKSASAAAAAIGFSAYLLGLIDGAEESGHVIHVAIALGAVVVLTVLVLSGLRRTNIVNTMLVLGVIGALIAFVIAGFAHSAARESAGDAATLTLWNWRETFHAPSLLEAAALMFVAYTGYGRIATMGEEVREPSRTIPRAIVIALVITAVIYVAVAVAAMLAVGPERFAMFSEGRGPLEAVARAMDMPLLGTVIAVAAMVAMLGVLLNLILGLSRVLLAMGRRDDAPRATARLNQSGTTPWVAVIVCAAMIGLIVIFGDFRVAWSFSAFTVLVYYAITNLAALRLSREARFAPAWVAMAGLIACLGLAFWVEMRIWLIGLGVLAAGMVWRVVWRWVRAPQA